MGYDNICVIKNKSSGEIINVQGEVNDDSECDFAKSHVIKLWVKDIPGAPNKILNFNDLDKYPDKKCKKYSVNEIEHGGIKFMGEC